MVIFFFLFFSFLSFFLFCKSILIFFFPQPYNFEVGKWYMITIVHDYHRITTSVVHLYVNGKLSSSAKLKYPYISSVFFSFLFFSFIKKKQKIKTISHYKIVRLDFQPNFQLGINLGIFVDNLVHFISLENH